MEYDDGDLMSIVLSCGRGKNPAVPTSATTTTATMVATDPSSFHLPPPPPPPPMFPPLLPHVSPPLRHCMFPMSFFATGFGGLEDLCTPFSSHFSPDQPHLQESLLISSDSPESTAVEHTVRVLEVPKMPALHDKKQQAASRSRKRKTKEQKKVTVQVPAESRASNDNWAWRKYGQKPIKGSPFPRGYYRCSTKKECPARKQVEKSWINPGMYIITYSDEHNHPLPAHRNSLAGCTRNRFPSSIPTKPNGESSSFSPTTPLTTSPISDEEEEEEEEEEEDGPLHVEDMEIAGPDELLFFGDASNAPDTSMEATHSGYFDVEDDPIFAYPLWANNAGGNK